MGRATHILRNLWRFLGSIRLAAILLAALLLASLLAGLLPQMPTDPTVRETWLAAVRLRLRGATGLLYALGLFDAYHAPWFLALVAALLLNTLLCTLQRLPRLWASLTRAPQVARPEAFYQSSARRATCLVPAGQDGLSVAQEVLARHRYRAFVQDDEMAGIIHLYAERGRWARAGTLISHTAALLLLLAVLLRPGLTWTESGVALFPGREHAVDRQPGLTVRAGQLAIDLHPDGQPRDYRVPLAILVDASPVLTRTVRLNHPLTFHGIAFHLQGYGPAAQVAAPEGRFDLAFASGQAQEVTLPEAGLILGLTFQPGGDRLVLEAKTAGGALLGSGTVADGDQIEVQGTPLTFRLGRYTTWQVSRDPTFAPALAAAGLLLAGIAISLWVPQRRLWLRLEGETIYLAGPGDADDITVIADEISVALAGAGVSGREADGQ
jgi:cytochrome c biogenesis protein